MMDILGLLSQTPQGNTVILMLIDQFTKWIECYSLPDQSAEVVAKTVVEDFPFMFGFELVIPRARSPISCPEDLPLLAIIVDRH